MESWLGLGLEIRTKKTRGPRVLMLALWRQVLFLCFWLWFYNLVGTIGLHFWFPHCLLLWIYSEELASASPFIWGIHLGKKELHIFNSEENEFSHLERSWVSYSSTFYLHKDVCDRLYIKHFISFFIARTIIMWLYSCFYNKISDKKQLKKGMVYSGLQFNGLYSVMAENVCGRDEQPRHSYL